MNEKIEKSPLVKKVPPFKKEFKDERQPMSSTKKRLLIMAVCGGLILTGFSAIKISEIRESLGHKTPCQSYELRKYLLYLHQFLENQTSQWKENHFLLPVVDQIEDWLLQVNDHLKEQDTDHFGDHVLEYAVEELEQWHYSTEGGDTVFFSEVMPDADDAAIALWSAYVASLHGLEGWDFSINVRNVTDKVVKDVNELILSILPNEGQTLIDAISTPGFEFETFYLEGRRVDLGVYEWGIQFLFYLPSDESPLEEGGIG